PCKNGTFTFSGRTGVSSVPVSWSCTPPPPAPTLTVTPTSLDQSSCKADSSGSGTYSCSVTVGETTSSQGSINWSVSSDLGSSVTFTPGSGNVAPGNTMSVSIDAIPCQNGTFTFSGQTGVSSVAVPWSCTPTYPVVTVTPNSLDPTNPNCTLTGTTYQCSVTVAESTSSQQDASWYATATYGSFSPSSGTLSPGQAVTVTIASLPCTPAVNHTTFSFNDYGGFGLVEV